MTAFFRKIRIICLKCCSLHFPSDSWSKVIYWRIWIWPILSISLKLDQYFLEQYFGILRNGPILLSLDQYFESCRKWTNIFRPIFFKFWKWTNIFWPKLWYWSKTQSRKVTKCRPNLQVQKMNALVTTLAIGFVRGN